MRTKQVYGYLVNAGDMAFQELGEIFGDRQGSKYVAG